jgi:hypothetical protein
MIKNIEHIISNSNLFSGSCFSRIQFHDKWFTSVDAFAMREKTTNEIELQKV